jgi:TPP-dependent pyruvate/acetoin dehydrogenase alpha subunit
MMQVDPIFLWGRRLVDQERFTVLELEAVDKEVTAVVDECVRFADQSPWPSPEFLYEDVYVRSPYIHLKNADRDPAWRASVREDKQPDAFWRHAVEGEK